jgi:ribose 5-phosphate isomerase B
MDDRWRIVIGSDAAGHVYRDALKADLDADPRVAETIDVDDLVDLGRLETYVQVATVAAREVTEGRADRALLICGSGLGVAMSANKVPGIRAVTASDSSGVERSVLDNDAQVLCFGQQVICLEVARRLAREWLDYRFNPRLAHNVVVIGRRTDFPGGDGDPMLRNSGNRWANGAGETANVIGGDTPGDGRDHRADVVGQEHGDRRLAVNVIPIMRLSPRPDDGSHAHTIRAQPGLPGAVMELEDSG